MSKIKQSNFFKIISIALVTTFIALDISWAYPPEHNTENSTLATPSLLQQNPINEQAARFQQSVLSQGELLGSVCTIGKYLLEEKLPIKYLDQVISTELGEAASSIDLSYIMVKDGIVLVPCEIKGKRRIIQIALKSNLAAKDLIGYEWLVSDKYVIKELSEDYEAPQGEILSLPKDKEPAAQVTQDPAVSPAQIVKTKEKPNPSTKAQDSTLSNIEGSKVKISEPIAEVTAPATKTERYYGIINKIFSIRAITALSALAAAVILAFPQFAAAASGDGTAFFSSDNMFWMIYAAATAVLVFYFMKRAKAATINNIIDEITAEAWKSTGFLNIYITNEPKAHLFLIGTTAGESPSMLSSAFLINAHIIKQRWFIWLWKNHNSLLREIIKVDMYQRSVSAKEGKDIFDTLIYKGHEGIENSSFQNDYFSEINKRAYPHIGARGAALEVWFYQIYPNPLYAVRHAGKNWIINQAWEYLAKEYSWMNETQVAEVINEIYEINSDYFNPKKSPAATLNFIGLFGLGPSALMSVFLAARDVTIAYPIPAGIAIFGLSIAAFFAIWRVFFPLSWHAFWLRYGGHFDVSHEEVLAKIGIHAIPYLKIALTDKDSFARSKAAEALDKIGWQPETLELKIAYLFAKQRWGALVEIGAPAVPTLIKASGDHDWYVSSPAAKALYDIKNRIEAEPLIAALNDNNSFIRSGAAGALDKIGWKPETQELKIVYLFAKQDWASLAKIGAPIAPFLIKLLSDNNWHIRSKTAEALGGIEKDPRATESLIKALNDVDSYVRLAAATALTKTGWKPKTQELKIAYLFAKQDWEALVKIGAPAIPTLVKTFSGNNLFIRSEAVVTLGNIKSPEAIEPLIKVLSDSEPSMRSEAARTLDKIGWTPETLELKIAYLFAKQDWEALVEIGAPAIPILKKASCDHDWYISSPAEEALDNIKRRHSQGQSSPGELLSINPFAIVFGAVGIALFIIWRIFDPVGWHIYWLRHSANKTAHEEALVIIGNCAVPSLIKLLADDDPFIRSRIVRILGNIKDPLTTEPLVKLLDNDNNPFVRSSVIKALGNIEDQRIEKILIKALGDNEPFVRSEAAGILGNPKYRDAAGPLIKALSDKEQSVRSRAVRSLGNRKDPEAREPIIKLLVGDKNPFVRSLAAMALGNMKDPENENPLIKALYDDNWSVRYQAAEALRHIRGREGAEPVIKAALDSKHTPDMLPWNLTANISYLPSEQRYLYPNLTPSIKDIITKRSWMWNTVGSEAERDEILEKIRVIKNSTLGITRTLYENGIISPEASPVSMYLTGDYPWVKSSNKSTIVIVVRGDRNFNRAQGLILRPGLKEISPDLKISFEIIGLETLRRAAKGGEFDDARIIRKKLVSYSGAIPLAGVDIFASANIPIENFARMKEDLITNYSDEEAEALSAWIDVEKKRREEESARFIQEAVMQELRLRKEMSLKELFTLVQSKVSGRLQDLSGEPELLQKLENLWDALVDLKPLSGQEEVTADAISRAIALTKEKRSLSDDETKILWLALTGPGQGMDDEARMDLLKVDPLINLLGDNKISNRSLAAEALVKIGTPAVSLLIKALGHSSSAVCFEITEVLGNIKEPGAAELLIKALSDDSSFIRSKAAEALGNIGPVTPEVVPALMETALKDNNSFVRSKSIEALGNIKDPRAVELIINAMGENKLVIRFAAAGALGNINDPKTLEPLRKAALSDKEPVVRSLAREALVERGITPSPVKQLFEIAESSVNNERTKFVNAGNHLIGLIKAKAEVGAAEYFPAVEKIDKKMPAGEIRKVVERAISTIEGFEKENVTPEIRDTAEYLKKNLSQFEADSAAAAIIVLARRAKRENQKLIIGLETDWIPGLDKEKSYQQNAIHTLMQEIYTVGETLKSMGLDNVEVIRGNSNDLAGKLLNGADKTHTNLRNIVVMASITTIGSLSFAPLRDADENNRPFLAGIDPTEIVKFYDTFGETLSNQLYVRLMQMLYMTLELAAGKEPPQTPMIVSYDSKQRIVIFLPKAEPMDYEGLKSTYAAEKTALSAA